MSPKNCRYICQRDWELLNAVEGTLLKMKTTYSKHGQTASARKLQFWPPNLLRLELNFHFSVNKTAHHKPPKAGTYNRIAVCAPLVSKVNTQRCIMWSEERKRWRADGWWVISQPLFIQKGLNMKKANRMHLTYSLCCPPLNMLVNL